MRFILYNKETGFIKCAENHGTTLLNVDEIKRNNPGLEFKEISEEECVRIASDLTLFSVKSGIISEKSVKEIKAVEKQREDWRRDNTIPGLREQIKNLKPV